MAFVAVFCSSFLFRVVWRRYRLVVDDLGSELLRNVDVCSRGLLVAGALALEDVWTELLGVNAPGSWDFPTPDQIG